MKISCIRDNVLELDALTEDTGLTREELAAQVRGISFRILEEL